MIQEAHEKVSANDDPPSQLIVAGFVTSVVLNRVENAAQKKRHVSRCTASIQTTGSNHEAVPVRSSVNRLCTVLVVRTYKPRAAVRGRLAHLADFSPRAEKGTVTRLPERVEMGRFPEMRARVHTRASLGPRRLGPTTGRQSSVADSTEAPTHAGLARF
jgi:hypothetical protein